MSGAQSQEIGAGRLNTTLLVNAMGSAAYMKNETTATTTDRYAAKVCDDFSHENEGVIYDDWFLPSLKELEQVYKNLFKATPTIGGLRESWYWSSSESITVSYVYEFKDGKSTATYRKESCRVRAVRAL